MEHLYDHRISLAYFVNVVHCHLKTSTIFITVKEFKEIKFLHIFAKGTKSQAYNKGTSYFFYLF
jgi:hypothetical protein